MTPQSIRSIIRNRNLYRTVVYKSNVHFLKYIHTYIHTYIHRGHSHSNHNILFRDNSLSAAEQLKLLKAEKIKNELNKKISSFAESEELGGSLGQGLISLLRCVFSFL